MELSTSLEMKNEGKKFGRYCSVEIRNFLTGEKHTIGNDFDISFEFFKTIDEVDNGSTGVIKVSGITKETFDVMKSDGGEVSLNVGYVNTEVQTLFVASITKMYNVIESGTIVTVIECSANVMNYHFSKGEGFRFVSLSDISLYEIMYRLSKSSGASPELDVSNVPEAASKAINEYLATKSYSLYLEGSDVKSAIRNSLNSVGINTSTENSNGGLIYVFTLTQDFVVTAIQEAESGYSKVRKKSEISSGKSKEDNVVVMRNMYETSKELEATATVLNWRTGLISAVPEFKIATVLETKQLAANESITKKSQETINERLRQEEERKNKSAQRVLEGKKPLKQKASKVATVRVNREYVRVKALLDPNIKPQSHIVLMSRLNDKPRLYRVRSVSYKGNNKSGEFIIDAYCEDSGGRYDSVATSTDIATRESLDNRPKTDLSALQVDGELGNDTSYGDEESQGAEYDSE